MDSTALAELRATLEGALETVRLLELAQRCADCGRTARELTPWFEDTEVVAYLGPTCHQRRLDALREAALGRYCETAQIDRRLL